MHLSMHNSRQSVIYPLFLPSLLSTREMQAKNCVVLAKDIGKNTRSLPVSDERLGMCQNCWTFSRRCFSFVQSELHNMASPK